MNTELAPFELAAVVAVLVMTVGSLVACAFVVPPPCGTCGHEENPDIYLSDASDDDQQDAGFDTSLSDARTDSGESDAGRDAADGDTD